MKLGDYKQVVIMHVPIERYFAARFPGWSPGDNVVCPFHDDVIASLSINLESGATYCHACDHKSSSVVGFHEQDMSLSFEDALRSLHSQWISPLVPLDELKQAREKLEGDAEVKAHLESVMGLSRDTILHFELGLSPDRERIWIPIKNEVGWVVDVRKYYWRRPRPDSTPKTISYRAGFGGTRLWPYSSMQFETVYLLEGERDTMLACQDGLNAVTLTTGGKTSLGQLKEQFRGKNVVLVPDVNDKVGTGVEGAKSKLEELRGIAQSVKIVELPLPGVAGGDYSDYRLGEHPRPHSLDELLQLVEDSATLYRAPRPEKRSRGEYRRISLRDVRDPDFFDKNVELRAHVVGKTQTPWLVPKKTWATCDPDKWQKCDECPLKESNGKRLVFIDDADRLVVGLCRASDAGVNARLKDHVNGSRKCRMEFKADQVHQVAYVSLVPELDAESAGPATYLIQGAYAVNCEVEANRGYDFRGYVTTDPNSQETVFVINTAVPVQDSIDKFDLTPEDISKLRIFQTETIEETFTEQAKMASTNITKIRGRDDLWLLCELAFHSVQGFTFGSEVIPKGWLDVLVIGDTRCGKGYTAERLVHFYKLGEVVSGENCTFAGLVGGMQQIGSAWQIIWGKLPLGDRRLVVLDEAKSLSKDDIGRMSRLRSEGIAEVQKIQSERTLARTRLIWLTNPRSGRLMRHYDYGVNAVEEFVGHAEDIARFDVALSVAQGEVDEDLINMPTPSEVQSPWPSDAMRKLVLWAWSRRPDQVRFTEGAVKITLEYAKKMGSAYSSAIPLVQVENVRYKIARLACAIAAKTFRTADGEVVTVDEECVHFAVKFMRRCYNKNSMGYDWYSETQDDDERVDDEIVMKIVERIDDKDAFIRGMLGTQAFSIMDMADFTGIDSYETKMIIGILVRHNCIYKTGPVYRKKPGFIRVLRRIQETRAAALK